MRNQFFPIFRLAFIVLVSIIFSNCEKDEVIPLAPEESITQTILDFEARNVAGTTLFQENKELERHIRTSFLSNDVQKNQLNSSVYNFSIDTDNVQVISGNTFDSYTFIVKRETATPNILENYILTIFSDGNYTQMLVTYPYIEENGEMQYMFNQATAQYIVDDNLLLGKSDSPCPSTSEEIIAWEDGGCVAVNCGLAGDHSPGEACEDGIVRAHWNCTGAWVVTGCVYTSGGLNTGTTDPSNSTTNGGGSTTDTNTPSYPPTIPIVPKTESLLDIDGIDLEMTEWLNEHPEFKQEMLHFRSEEWMFDDTDLEIFLMLKSESSTQPWIDYSGNFNNINTLPYNQIRHMAEGSYIYTEFKLLNGDIIMRGDFSPTNDIDRKTFYYSKENKRLFRIPEPFNDNPSVDLNFLWNGVWATVQTGVRYCTPLEDVLVLIEGEDFDGVESSQAVSGIMVLIDITPVGKVTKIVKKAGQVITNSVPVITRVINSIYKLQRKLFKKYKGLIANMSNAKKGRWAEMGTDVDMIGKGYKEQHGTRITSIDNGGHNGVDHVFKNEETGEFLIVESKYKPSGDMAYTNPPGTNTDLPRQMSDDWLTYNDNLANSVGETLADEILESSYKKLLAIVNPDGTITYRLIDELGNVINGAAGIYHP